MTWRRTFTSLVIGSFDWVKGSPVRPSRETAFTLIELLVVIAIIGILIALLLPAVQTAREAARMTQCANNLRQIGLAIQLYQQQHEVYVMGRDTSTQWGVSWAFRLLPHLEQTGIYESMDYRQRVDSAVNAYAMRTPVTTFVCPSRRSPQPDRNFDDNDQSSKVRGVAAPGDYAANNGRIFNYYLEKPTWSASVAGPIHTYSRVTPVQVTDGTSNTLAVGERYIPPPRASSPGFEHYDIGDCAFFAADNPWTIFAATGAGFPTGPLDSDRGKFGSEHDNMAQFVFLDGRVYTLNYSVSLGVLQALSIVGDGVAISSHDY